jgi:toxin CcdB
MRQFDVHRLKEARGRGSPRLVVVLQHDVSDDLETRVVAPLARPQDIPHAQKLRPIISLDATDYVLVADRLAAVDRGSIGQRVGSAERHRDAIVTALDFLFTGY